jgi:uncharacterized protein YhaN
MKILRLDLRAFGPFTNVSLDLAGGEHGLHVIYGPNEAGKSATLRAVQQLFYGIPERTTDAFRHPYDKLRIGAQLRHSDGAVLECIRRKARINALRRPDDKTVIDAGELNRFLAGADEKFFETMFGIDHPRLVMGGKAILDSHGQLGQALFAAGTGVANLRAVQDGLQSEIGDLFRPTGRTQRINKALGELRDTQLSVKRQQLSAEDWARHDREFHAAEQQKKQVESERQQKSRELRRLSRIRDALPAIARRKELLTELAEYHDAVLLPPGFPEKRQSALETLRVAETQAHEAELALAQIDQELKALEVPETLLERAERIEDLNRRLGEYRKNLQDRPSRVLHGKLLEHDAKEILRSLHRPVDLEQAEELRLRVDEPVEIQNLGTLQQGLISLCKSARAARDDLVNRIDLARQKLAGLAAPQDPAELGRLIRAVQKQGPLEEQFADQQKAIRQAEKQAVIDVARLTLWSGPLEKLEQLALPAAETIDRFESNINQLQSMYNQLGERTREVEGELRELDGQIDRLEREQAVPSEEDLQKARQLRDAGWRLVRGAWIEQDQEESKTTEFIANFSPAGNLAEAYERGVERADLVADRLRREANRVAGKAKLLADRSQRCDQLDKLNDQLRETTDRLTQLGVQWTTLWQPLGIQPLPPREMRSWVRKQDELARQVQALREQREQAERIHERIQTQRRQLGAQLQKLGELTTSPDETVVEILQRGQELVDRFDKVKRQREQFEGDIAGHTQELPAAEARVEQIETDLAHWQEQWAAAMARLGLGADSSPAQANAVLAAITTLFQKLHEADGFRRRIDGMDRDAAQFQADVQEMVQRTAPDLADLDVEAAEQELHARLLRGRNAQQSRQILFTRRGQEAGKLHKAQEALTATRSQLEAMCREAGCARHEDLPRAEQRSTRRQQLENDIRQREEHLLTLSAGTTLDEFIADAARVDADSIELSINGLGKQIKDLESAMSQLDQTIGSERAILAGMNENAAAGEAAECAHNLLAQLHTDVEHYVELRLAATVLKEAIERYRKKNQGSILARAGAVFAALTIGSFESLQIDYDDANEPILLGVRSGTHEAVGVAGMSDGSCDQLYLALRLASLEAYLEKHEPIPFIVDDILLHFDNARAAAALEALAALSRRTQVLFFTHHEHLVEMARRCEGEGVVCTHRLPEGTVP